MSPRTLLLLAPWLALACRPPPTEPVDAPRAQPPLFVATPDRIYTTAPIRDRLSYVPVTEKTIQRRAGRVAVALSYPEIDLPSRDREVELADAIRRAAALDSWTDDMLEGRVGTVEVTCVTPLATTALVSIVCERRDGTVRLDNVHADLAVAAGKILIARTFDVRSGPVRPLAWTTTLLPDITRNELIAAALAGESDAVRGAWLSGHCVNDDFGFSVHTQGIDIWPDQRSPLCPQLSLERERLIGFLIPNGIVAQTFRLAGEPEPEVVESVVTEIEGTGIEGTDPEAAEPAAEPADAPAS